MVPDGADLTRSRRQTFAACALLLLAAVTAFAAFVLPGGSSADPVTASPALSATPLATPSAPSPLQPLPTLTGSTLTLPLAERYAQVSIGNNPTINGTGRVIMLGVALVALGTFITPYMTTTWGLIFAIGVLAAGGAGMAGPSVLMAATTRLVPPHRRGLATGVVNAGGSFGQFVMAPIAISLTAAVGWGSASKWPCAMAAALKCSRCSSVSTMPRAAATAGPTAHWARCG